ncbi:GNAT family N-acetyltransferase [Halobacterium litoreum]|uniref:GNAT family N-acetyltransferase n=1 Tax=Halobacterium litoreum TaxID=2039234 RepID=A0ABD5NH36_9EURY|nr:GNAT family protein [Halobacterium litoreum]UHH12557.1 GNAT family N-acetyltransferase [Halobacterium litoreum]
MPGTVFRRGDRVTLCTVEHEDAEFVQRGHNHPDVGVSLGLSQPENESEAESHVAQYEDDPLNVSLLVCVDGEGDGPTPVGKVSLMDLHHTRPEISYWVLPEYHGNGYGTEAVELLVDYAFSAHEIRGLQAQAFAPNEGSVGVLENLGFTHEGTLRDARFRDGEYVDVVWYGLLREEWEDN